MKMVVLCGITLLAAAPALAQIVESRPENTVTLAGCVGDADSKGISLTNPMIIPGTVQPGQIDQTPPIPPTVSPATTEQPTSATPPTSTTAAGTPSPIGTSGTTRTASGAVGTSGVISTAPDSNSTSIVSGYRLSGADMKPWIGQRVQVLGTFVPAAPSAAAQTKVTGGASTPPVLEFKVQTVQPMSGPCPK